MAIAPRALAPILRDLKAADIAPGAPADLTLADLDSEVSTALDPEIAQPLQTAVAGRVLARWRQLAHLEPFADAPNDFTLAQLGLTVRSSRAMSHLPVEPLQAATIEDLVETPGLGAVGLVDVLAAYEAYCKSLPAARNAVPPTRPRSQDAPREPTQNRQPMPTRARPGGPLAIAPRVLEPILRDVAAADVVRGAPPGLSLADFDSESTARLEPDLVRKLRRAVEQRVRNRWRQVAKIEPFRDLPEAFALADLGLPVRSYNAMGRLPVKWLKDATIEDLFDTRGLGVVGLVEVLAAYDSYRDSMPKAEAMLAPTSPPEEAVLSDETKADIELEAASEAETDRKKQQFPQRVLDMAQLYENGASLEEVGTAFDITRERVRQIFIKRGVPLRSSRETHALRRRQLMDARRDEIYGLVDAGQAPREIADRLKISLQVVRDVIAQDPDRSRIAAFRRNAGKKQKPRYTDEEIVECLRVANVELGGVLTSADYTKFARTRTMPDGRPWPLSQTPGLRFGSWREALLHAGLEANPPSAVAGQRLFTRGHCVDAILELERELGHPPTAAEYERAAVARSGALPSLATVRNRCGGWQSALSLAARFSR